MPDPAAPATTNPAQTPDASAAADAASTPESGEPNWFAQFTGQAPADDSFEAGTEPSDEQAGQTEPGAQGSAPGPQAEQPAPEPQPKPKPKQDSPGPDDVVRLTRTQLEREIQSRADKLLAKQAREAERRAHDQALVRKAKEDPYAFSEDFLAQREQEEALTSQVQPVHNAITATARQYDQLVVDRVVTSLPPEVQQRLHQQIQPVGVEGRGRMVAAALDEIRRAAVAEGKAAGEKAAEQKLRKNAAFRKELLAELRGSEDEPESLPAGGRSPRPTSMDDVFRSWLHVGRA